MSTPNLWVLLQCLLCYTYEYKVPNPDNKPLSHLRTSSAPLASSQPDSLSIFLQFRDQAISLLHDISILLVLVIRSVCLDDFVDAVDGAGNAVCGDEFGEITTNCQPSSV